MLTPKEIIKRLKLIPNEAEGGFFAGTYECSLKIADAALPGFPSTGNSRPLCGAIYYFLEAGVFSAMHKVTGDMLYHFYSGHPVEMLLLYPDNYPDRFEVCIFGNDIAAGHHPMKVIPGGTWLGSRLTPGGAYALMGVTMAPGFHPNDYVVANNDDLIADLIAKYPKQQEMIEELTRKKITVKEK